MRISDWSSDVCSSDLWSPPWPRSRTREEGSDMPRFERRVLLEKFQAMKRRGEPIVGGGAGTGLSAKCEEAGGIDLIVIYNSGRYRMAGRGSLSGLLAYGKIGRASRRERRGE